MFGFGKHKKIARGIAHSIIEPMIKMPFIGSKYAEDNDKQFPPDNFFEDQYVVGFINGFAVGVWNFQFGGQSKSRKQNEEFIFEFWLALRGQSAGKIISMVKNESLKESSLFKEATDAALTCVALDLGLLRSEFNSPLLEEAKTLDPKDLKFLDVKLMDMIDPENPISNTQILSQAAKELSFYKYLNDHFL